MKGIILAGGAGTRLYPITQVASKQLQPVYDKPMIYYPLSTLMLGGIRDILLISTPHDIPRFQDLLGDGSQWGITLTYMVQEKPEGIAQAFILGEEFIDGEPVALILGDNIFHGNLRMRELVRGFEQGALVFGYYVHDPERYGVVAFDDDGNVLGIEEKPSKPKTNYAVPGLYFYDGDVAAMSRALKPSPRGELEITDLNLAYLAAGKLKVQVLGRGIAWLDTGTHQSLLEASNYVFTLQDRTGLQIANLEEISLFMKFATREQVMAHVEAMPRSGYRDYLEKRVLEIS